MIIHPPESPGATFCAAAGISDDLAERLLLDGAGRPFAPVALTAIDDPVEMTAQFDLLLRPEPVGGGEALLKENGERVGDAGLARLHRRLAAGADLGSIRSFLSSLRPELSQLDADLDTRAEAIGRELRSCQTALRAWQEATSQEPGLLRNLAGWIFGGAGRIALPQAVALWNERERLTFTRQAISTARAVIRRLADEVDTLLESQEAMRQSAERARRTAQDRLAAPRRGAEPYGPWTWQGNPDALAAQLARRVADEQLVAALIARVSAAGGADRLADDARALAEAEAAKIVGALSIAEAITVEAGELDDAGIDPLVLVGQQLLSVLEQSASWRLQRGARPRVEVVQVTGSGAPLFQLDGLGTAAYGDKADRIGFVRLESGVASDDLRAMHEGTEAFAQILAQRNLYVLEELAREAAPAPEAPAAPSAAPTSNGVPMHEAWRSSDG